MVVCRRMGMSANRRDDWATRNVGLPLAVKKRLEGLKLIPQEPSWRVVERLLDEHDAVRRSAPSVAQGVASA